jgi:hypothetical protein
MSMSMNLPLTLQIPFGGDLGSPFGNQLGNQFGNQFGNTSTLGSNSNSLMGGIGQLLESLAPFLMMASQLLGNQQGNQNPFGNQDPFGNQGGPFGNRGGQGCGGGNGVGGPGGQNPFGNSQQGIGGLFESLGDFFGSLAPLMQLGGGSGFQPNNGANNLANLLFSSSSSSSSSSSFMFS